MIFKRIVSEKNRIYVGIDGNNVKGQSFKWKDENPWELKK